ncbi:hypothetical protein FB562_0641 [Homoserinimonas aerilata]|uniref:BNR repeat protein n=1 Tax=Homoserinimonas aerilata TaxID=1162970 RepID=A0A542YHM3_9MICO|nr:hypothetical protein [Homoserinimonas aerilata]TQL47576.1 hypothetical protein FB562_0641 [Homoserinimonas aerilata]
MSGTSSRQQASRRVTQRKAVAAFAAAALTFGLAGCVPEPGLTPPLVDTVTIDVPDSMLHSGDEADIDGAVLPGDDALPFAFGGSLTAPGEGGIPTVWVSDDGEDWEAVTVAEIDGSFTGTLAGDASLTALGGQVWHDGLTRSRLWASENRTTWTEVDLPQRFADKNRITAIAVTDGRVIVLGPDRDGTVSGVVITGDEITEIEPPQPEEGELLGIAHVVAHDDHAILIANPAAEGDNGAAVSYVSDDGGLTWGDTATPIGGTDDRVRGAVWTGGRYVLTGAGVNDDNRYGAAAWSSADGTSWTVETVPPSSENHDSGSLSSDWLGAPGTNKGIVSSLGGNDNSSESSVYTRSADGVWTFRSQTSANPASGMSGASVPRDAASVIGIIEARGSLRSGIFSIGRGWTDTVSVASTVDPSYISSIDEHPDGIRLTLARSRFTITDGGWKNTSELSAASFDGDRTVEDDPVETEGMAGLSSVVRATSDGEELVLGSEFLDGSLSILIRGQHKASGSDEWVPVTGFPTEGAIGFHAAAKVGGLWVATGDARASAITGQARHANIWTSPNGVAWTSAGPFGGEDLQSQAYETCALPNGDPIAVGHAETKIGEYRAVAWSPAANGMWQRLNLGELDDSYGWFDGCASNDDGVIVSAKTGGRDVLLFTDDGIDWKTVFTATRGSSISSPVAVDGGFVASGGWARGNASRPVVWVSADGAEWTPLAVPSTHAGATGIVTASGDDLLVSMSARTGHPLLAIRDIADVIAAATRR